MFLKSATLLQSVKTFFGNREVWSDRGIMFALCPAKISSQGLQVSKYQQNGSCISVNSFPGFFSPDKLWRGDQISHYISILVFSLRGGSGPQCPATWQLHLIICQPRKLNIIFFLVKLSLDRLPSSPSLFTKDMHEFWLNMADCSKYFEGSPLLVSLLLILIGISSLLLFSFCSF